MLSVSLALSLAPAFLPSLPRYRTPEGPPRTQESPAERILDRARAAASAIDEAHFHGIITRRLRLANRIWRAEGLVDSDRDGKRLRVDGEVELPGDGESRDARVFADGSEWSFADDGRHTWTSGDSADIGGDASRLLADLSLESLIGSDPYSGERAVEVRGPQKVNRSEFWVLETVSTDGSRRSTWYLSTDDFMPRQCDRVTALDRGEELVERILHGPIGSPPANPWGALAPTPEMVRVEPLEEAPFNRELVPLQEREVPVTSLTGSVDALRDAFEAARGKHRIIALFAPT